MFKRFYGVLVCECRLDPLYVLYNLEWDEMFILLEYIDNKEKQQLERLRLQMHSTYNAMVGGVKLTDVLRFEWDVDSNIVSKQKAQIDKNSDEFKKYLAEITKRVNAMPE